MRISDWSSDVCSSDLALPVGNGHQRSQPGENGPRRSVRDHPAAPEGEAPRLRCRALLQVLKPPPMSAPHKRSEEHTSELQSLMRISYAVFCLKKKNKNT